MKIGIMTFQGAKNCGAVLQSYALSTVLENMGHSADLVNFISDGEYERTVKSGGLKKGKAYWARKIYYIFFQKDIKKRNKLFEEFQDEYLKLNPKKERIREKELSEYTKIYQCLVCGSDQIWSRDPKLYDRSEAYYINFPFDGRKVSYAASFGDNINYSEAEVNKIISYIRKFDAVSVREKEAADFLQDNEISSTICVDPTMFLKKEDWLKIAIKPQIKEKYILYFSVNSRSYSINVAKKLSKQTGIKVIELNPHPKSWNSGFQKMYGNGPREFLGFILNAEYIVTNSYHGTVFSILFNKPFVAAFDEKDGNIVIESRKETLLKNVGLDSLMVTENAIIDIDAINSINWNKVNIRIDDLRSDSLNYLKDAIED
ncbi:MAG: polysaccharide pyruvyl transferase family protein [Ruminococcus sp.]|nr:polysaccharide pyruvyl transferase family protein [Ruminococcus sp.]